MEMPKPVYYAIAFLAATYLLFLFLYPIPTFWAGMVIGNTAALAILLGHYVS